MSKGRPHYKCRLDAETAALVHATIGHRNAHSNEAPWTLSDFLRIACREKIAKMNRSRRRPITIADEPADLASVADPLPPEVFFGKTLEDGGAFA